MCCWCCLASCMRCASLAVLEQQAATVLGYSCAKLHVMDNDTQVANSGKESNSTAFVCSGCRAERAQRVKQRRRQWLLKMYRTGMQAVSTGPGSSSAAAAAAAGQQPSASGMLPCADPCISSSTTQQQQQQRRPGSAHEPVPCQACSHEEQLLRQLEQQLLLTQGADSACGTTSSSTVLQQFLQPGGSTGRAGSTDGTRIG